ncbi:hypothetical protein ACO2JO_17145 [Leptospira interrogans]
MKFLRSSTKDGTYEVPVQASWSLGAIEPHGDASGTSAHLNDNASPVSELGAPRDSKFTHLETGADKNSVDVLVNHFGYSISRKRSSSIKARRQSQGSD